LPNVTLIAERILMGLLVGGIAAGCLFVLWPFFSAILWAAILVYTTWPLHEWLRTRGRLGRGGAAGAMVALAFVVVVLPIALAVPGSADDVDALRKVVMGAVSGGLPSAPSWLRDVPAIGPMLASVWDSWAADLSAMGEFFKPYFGLAAEFALSVVLGLANGVLRFLLALFVAFFLFASGDILARRIQIILGRIAGTRAPRLIEVTGATVRGVVYGILGTAIVQGILTAFGLWLSGVPRPLLLGVLAGGLSVLPVGAPLVWIPSALWLLGQGHTVWGLLLVVYGTVAISGADSVIRPFFISRGAQLPFLLTMLGVLGGALAFGLLGIFVGPALLGVGFTLVAEWSGAEPATPGAPPLDPAKGREAL
jgi:predicted PurR-regulated permease PerM